MKQVQFLTPAIVEFDEAVDYYEGDRLGLGVDFQDEIKAALRRIVANPLAWPRVSRLCRRCRTSRFPYGVIYQVRDEAIMVVAIMHLSRKPDYWKDRV